MIATAPITSFSPAGIRPGRLEAGVARGEVCGVGVAGSEVCGGVVGSCVAAAASALNEVPETGWPSAVLCADAGLTPAQTASTAAPRTASHRYPARNPGLVNGRAVMSRLCGDAIRPPR
jgi:hypothetical protein